MLYTFVDFTLESWSKKYESFIKVRANVVVFCENGCSIIWFSCNYEHDETENVCG